MTEHYNKYKHLQLLIDDLSSMKDDLSKMYNDLREKFINAIPIPPEIPDKKYYLAETFIGYGNPDADILIVGKECAIEGGSEGYKEFYEPNFKQWKDSFEGHGFGFTDGAKYYSFENYAFHPLFPFYWKCNSLKQKCSVRKTSPTYYYYQMLIDKIRAEIEGKYVKSECITFFRDCFITELNEICMLSHKHEEKVLKYRDAIKKLDEAIEASIKTKFDWMSATSFFKQFKVVVLACGPYANKIKENKQLKEALFGDAEIVYCGQLSQWRKKELEGDNASLPNCIKQIAEKKPKISSIAENIAFIKQLPHNKCNLCFK